MSIVLDASMALAWHFGRQDPLEDSLASKCLVEIGVHSALVPALWFSEISNGVLIGERRRVATEAQTHAYLEALSRLALSVDAPSQGTFQPAILALARVHNLTAYDATYLELAVRRASALATFDRKLAEACRKAKVPVFGDP
jgi:predicted nucleic acid-binding protein